MAQDNGPNRQRDDRNSTQGSNLLLLIGLLVVSTLLVVMWIAPLFSHELDAGPLKELIQASAKGGAGFVDVLAKDGKTYRYSKLQDVTVRHRSITGKVDR